MKALVLKGSPRENGNTDLLTGKFIEGFEDAGGDAEIIDAVKTNVRPCTGCLSCEEKGQCIIRDEMDEIYKKVEETDILVLSSPVYFASFSAQLKTIIDRFQANFSKKYVLKHKDEKKRKGYLIFTAGGKNEEMILSMELSAKFFFLSCNACLVKTIYALDTDTKCINDREELLKEAYNCGYDAAGYPDKL